MNLTECLSLSLTLTDRVFQIAFFLWVEEMLVKLKMMLAFLFFNHYPLQQHSIYSLVVLIAVYAFKKLTHEPVTF